LVEDVVNKNRGTGRFERDSVESHESLLLLLYVLYCQGISRKNMMTLRRKLHMLQRRNWSPAPFLLTLAIFACIGLMMYFWGSGGLIGCDEMVVLLRRQCRALLPLGCEAVLRWARSPAFHILRDDAETFARRLLERSSSRASSLWSSACAFAAGAVDAAAGVAGSGAGRYGGLACAPTPAQLWPCAAVLGFGLCQLWRSRSGRRALWLRAAGLRAQVRVAPPDGGAVRLLAEGLDPRVGWAAGAAAEWGRCGAAERLDKLDKLARWAGYAGGVAVVLDRVDDCAALAPHPLAPHPLARRSTTPAPAADGDGDGAGAGAGVFAGSWCGMDGWAAVRRFVFLALPRARLLAQPGRPVRLDKLKVRSRLRLGKRAARGRRHGPSLGQQQLLLCLCCV
jgi:hypothetical protein